MRILGIDIGTTSVKAVELDSAFGRLVIHEYHEQGVPAGSNPVYAAQQLISSLPRQPDKIVTTLRSNRVTFRNLTLPTRDRKAIQSSVGFELDDDLPFPIESAAYDFSIVSQSTGQSTVHVAATLRKNLESFLGDLINARIDPDLLTTEAWAYRTLFNKLTPLSEQQRPVLLLQIGEEHTTLYLHWKGAPVMIRDFAWGGRDLTQAIAQKYAITLEAAEKAKLDSGFVLPPSQRADATPEQVEFSDAMAGTLRELLREVRQAGLSCKNLTHEKIGTVYLSGGSSLLPGLLGFIAEETQVSVQPLQALSSIAGSGVTYSEQTDASFSLAIASALCLVGSERGQAINLRKGQYSKQGRSTEINLSAIKGPLIGASVVLSCMLVSLAVQSQVYTRRLDTANTQLEKAVKSFFGNLANSAVKNYLADPTKLRSSISKELNKQRELARLLGPNPRNPLDFLNSLSKSIPRDVVVDMTRFQVGAAPGSAFSPTGDASTQFTFLVSNPQIAERLAGILGSYVTNLERAKPEEVTTEDGSKKWKVTFGGSANAKGFGGSNGR